MEAGWGRPGCRLITQVSGRCGGVRRAGLLGCLGREQLRASGPPASLRSPNYWRAAPPGFLRRGGAGGWGRREPWRGAAFPPLSPALPPHTLGRPLMERSRLGGLSGVSRPEPISAESAFPKSCKQPPWPVLERGGRLGRGGGEGAGGGVTHPTGLLLGMRLPWQRG